MAAHPSSHLGQHSMRLATAFALALGIASSPAFAWGYTINGRPADPFVSQYLSALGLPSGHYWLNAQGDWGVVGDPRPKGNIYGNNAGPSVVYPPRGGTPPLYRDGNGCYYMGDYSNC